MDPAFLNRNVNQGFSGGEKKRNEILQLACLDADCSILDEIDSGLDIDALRDVSRAVNGLKEQKAEMGVLMVTHYKVCVLIFQLYFIIVYYWSLGGGGRVGCGGGEEVGTGLWRQGVGPGVGPAGS